MSETAQPAPRPRAPQCSDYPASDFNIAPIEPIERRTRQKGVSQKNYLKPLHSGANAVLWGPLVSATSGGASMGRLISARMSASARDAAFEEMIKRDVQFSDDESTFKIFCYCLSGLLVEGTLGDRLLTGRLGTKRKNKGIDVLKNFQLITSGRSTLISWSLNTS